MLMENHLMVIIYIYEYIYIICILYIYIYYTILYIIYIIYIMYIYILYICIYYIYYIYIYIIYIYIYIYIIYIIYIILVTGIAFTNCNSLLDLLFLKSIRHKHHQENFRESLADEITPFGLRVKKALGVVPVTEDFT